MSSGRDSPRPVWARTRVIVHTPSPRRAAVRTHPLRRSPSFRIVRRRCGVGTSVRAWPWRARSRASRFGLAGPALRVAVERAWFASLRARTSRCVWQVVPSLSGSRVRRPRWTGADIGRTPGEPSFVGAFLGAWPLGERLALHADPYHLSVKLWTKKRTMGLCNTLQSRRRHVSTEEYNLEYAFCPPVKLPSKFRLRCWERGVVAQGSFVAYTSRR